ncbi:DUF4839 domain-containing protein [Microbacterium oxydans]|uniref:DUF4839 domain-containing protein n=1 Tax=Microbacterium oxydans TaxID=82380 RepID=UPI0024AD412D|nr:DUF4839 domain-containing protein [Microbacterium oxydans]
MRLKRGLASATALALVLALAACGGSGEKPSGINMPQSSSDLEGQPYQDVVRNLEDAGFSNVEAVALEDLITGWINEEDSVDEVDADGIKDFTTDDYFEPDVKIVVTYHSFPEDKEEDPSAEPSAPAAGSTISADNNAEFDAILASSDYCSSEIAAFADSHSIATIEFDGNIGAMNNHDGASTRYDILIGAGDFDPNSQPGPAFQFRDVNITSDLALTGDNIPDTIGVGQNLHITAVVMEFDVDTCLFELAPVETRVR